MTRLKHERHRRRLTQRRLGQLAQIPQPIISLVERGRLLPTPDQLDRLAATFDVLPADLLKEVVVIVEVA